MNAVKFFIRFVLLYIILLGAILASILYVRTDIQPKDFISNKFFWIIPIALLYIMLNFKSLFSSIINKILLVAILFWIGTQYFPTYTKQLLSIVKQELPSEKEITRKTNELLTPKNGDQPKLQLEEKIQRKKLKKEQPYINTNNDPSPIPKDEPEIKPKEELSIGGTANMIQEKVNGVLKQNGIEVPNSRQPIDNLDKKNSNINDSLFK